MKHTKHEPDSTVSAPRSLASLMKDLGAAEVSPRLRARNELVARGEAVLPPLMDALTADEFLLRWEAAGALGELRTPRAVSALVAALEDEEQDVRWLVAVALAAIGRPALRPLLEALLEHPDSAYLRKGTHHVLTIYTDASLREPLQKVVAALGPLEDPADVVPAAADMLDALGVPEEGEAP